MSSGPAFEDRTMRIGRSWRRHRRDLRVLVADETPTRTVAATYPLADYKQAFEHPLADQRDGKALVPVRRMT
jgi:hypothetical protein